MPAHAPRRPARHGASRLAVPAALLASLGLAACADPTRPSAAGEPGGRVTAVSASPSTAGSPAFQSSKAGRLGARGLSADESPADDRAGFVKFGTFFRTDVAVAGVGGIRNVGSGTIALAGVSGSVNRAYLYWHAVTNSTDPAVDANITVNGSAVVGRNIGFSSDNCWGYANSQAYVADVTDLVRARGNGAYDLAGLGSSTPANGNGASLIVFYQDGNTGNDRDMVLYHGNDSNISNVYDAPGWNVSLADITYTSGAAAMQLHVADGQVFSSADAAVYVNNQVLLPVGPNFQGSTVPSANNGPTNNGSLWDIRTFDVARFLTPGNNTLTLEVRDSGDDCLALVTALVQLAPGSAPTPPFVFVPTKISLSLSASINVYLFSTAAFDATQVNAATTRLYIGGRTTGAPVAQRGTAYLTSTGDYNGDGRTDRIMAFRVSDLIANGLTASSTGFVLADRTGTVRFEGVPDLAPQIVP